jgi:hypothetical protein
MISATIIYVRIVSIVPRKKQNTDAEIVVSSSGDVRDSIE